MASDYLCQYVWYLNKYIREKRNFLDLHPLHLHPLHPDPRPEPCSNSVSIHGVQDMGEMGVGPQGNRSPLTSLVRIDPEAKAIGDEIHLSVSENRSPHIMDSATYLQVKAMLLFGGWLLFNSNRAKDKEGARRYAVLKLNQTTKVPLDRLVADAVPGQIIREGVNYHRHFREELKTVETTARPSKFNLGREDAMAAALENLDRATSRGAAVPLNRQSYRRMMLDLFEIADAMSALRRLPMIAVAA